MQLASKGWRVQYQQRYIQTEAVILQIEQEIGSNQVMDILSQSLASGRPDRFPFPVAFSSSLDRLAVLRTIFTVTQSKNDENLFDLKVQELKPRGSRGVQRATKFAPNGKAIAFIHGRTGITQIMEQRPEIWSQDDGAAKEDEFYRRGTVKAMWQNPHESSYGVPTPGYIFHPSLPLFVFSEWTRLSLWWFNRDGELHHPKLSEQC